MSMKSEGCPAPVPVGGVDGWGCGEVAAAELLLPARLLLEPLLDALERRHLSQGFLMEARGEKY